MLLKWKELYITQEMFKCKQIEDILQKNSIVSEIKISSSTRNIFRGRSTGEFGMSKDHIYQYRVYVKREDFEKAKHLIKS